MRAYYDGSWRPKDVNASHAEQLFSWGIVFDDGEITELHGSRSSHGDLVVGCHEVIAFIETALYCSSHGITPENVSFTTDDEVTAYGSKATVSNGYSCTSMNVALESILDRLVRVKMYDAGTISSVRPYLERSVFHKVKGHKMTLLNLRCDYLAGWAAKVHQNLQKKFHGFEEWAARGFNVYHRGEQVKWFPPFHGTPETV